MILEVILAIWAKMSTFGQNELKSAKILIFMENADFHENSYFSIFTQKSTFGQFRTKSAPPGGSRGAPEMVAEGAPPGPSDSGGGEKTFIFPMKF